MSASSDLCVEYVLLCTIYRVRVWNMYYHVLYIECVCGICTIMYYIQSACVEYVLSCTIYRVRVWNMYYHVLYIECVYGICTIMYYIQSACMEYVLSCTIYRVRVWNMYYHVLYIECVCRICTIMYYIQSACVEYVLSCTIYRVRVWNMYYHVLYIECVCGICTIMYYIQSACVEYVLSCTIYSLTQTTVDSTAIPSVVVTFAVVNSSPVKPPTSTCAGTIVQTGKEIVSCIQRSISRKVIKESAAFLGICAAHITHLSSTWYSTWYDSPVLQVITTLMRNMQQRPCVS